MFRSGSGLSVAREHKERRSVDNLNAPEPSWHCPNLCLDLPTGEGRPHEWGLGADCVKVFGIAFFQKGKVLSF